MFILSVKYAALAIFCQNNTFRNGCITYICSMETSLVGSNQFNIKNLTMTQMVQLSLISTSFPMANLSKFATCFTKRNDLNFRSWRTAIEKYKPCFDQTHKARPFLINKFLCSRSERQRAKQVLLMTMCKGMHFYGHEVNRDSFVVSADWKPYQTIWISWMYRQSSVKNTYKNSR